MLPDQAIDLVKLTPHRVMRELYAQFIAYRALFDAIVPQYMPDDNYLAGVVDGAGSALVSICGSDYDVSAATLSAFGSESSFAIQDCDSRRPG